MLVEPPLDEESLMKVPMHQGLEDVMDEEHEGATSSHPFEGGEKMKPGPVQAEDKEVTTWDTFSLDLHPWTCLKLNWMGLEQPLFAWSTEMG